MHQGERILLTGATGFVGSHLAELLAARGGRPRAVVRSTSDVSRLEACGAERVVCTLEDTAALVEAMAGCAVVVHLAAVTHARRESEYHRVNADGTRAVLAAARAADPGPRRVVYLSSLAAVGPARDGRPVRCENEPRPLTAYGRSKLAGERACLAAGPELETVIVRAPAVYGPRDREMLRLFRMAARGVVPVPGDPSRKVQLIHAADLAAALAAAAEVEGAAGIYHAAEPRAYEYGEVARMIAAAVGRRALVVRVPAAAVTACAALGEAAAGLAGRSTLLNRDKARELLAPGWLCETERAERELGFTPRFALAEGLEDTARWYRAHGWL